ncbi:hypothetical protein EST38_g6360 [Candolleomyces aberdarensis]|uniref:L-tryptophan decarboxylase PsiD-like domain-containing protein n=1 Tax=Candolleomyces aberdarensis TaxID=2316362 RepID=A0A4Q2DI15_9AGAR|nr:hypothetical protein EST38_g6360 [Candolleomyces aberdarensis]
MLVLFNHQLTRAPAFRGQGIPFYEILRESMNTTAGRSTLLSEKLNAQLKKILEAWSIFLNSPSSRHVLVPDENGGWFSPSALAALTRPFSSDDAGSPRLEEIFDCDPHRLYYGFKSWDAFFTRPLRPGIRLLEDPDVSDVINSPCECSFYNLQHNVAELDEFWIKGEVYSLRNMFNNDPDFTQDFVGGTIYQGFLSASSYHRWHSPVDGVVRKITLIPGAYYVQSPTAFVERPDDPDDHPYLRSQAFITSLTTRMVIFIESSNPAIGTMCLVAVGMVEVSTCEATVSVGEGVRRGQEIGMFHFGGSSFCVVFRPGKNIRWNEDVIRVGAPVKVRGRLGVAVQPEPL